VLEKGAPRKIFVTKKEETAGSREIYSIMWSLMR
jgi:hypothetical protein